MTLSKRVLLIIGLLVITLVSAACGGGGSGGGSGSATDAAKNWITALFAGDGNALRNNTCDAQKGEITDQVVSDVQAAFTQGGASVDASGLTYTFDDATDMVTVAGTIKVTVSGVAVDSPVPFPSLPVVQEGGTWKVCAPLS